MGVWLKEDWLHWPETWSRSYFSLFKPAKGHHVLDILHDKRVRIMWKSLQAVVKHLCGLMKTMPQQQPTKQGQKLWKTYS